MFGCADPSRQHPAWSEIALKLIAVNQLSGQTLQRNPGFSSAWYASEVARALPPLSKPSSKRGLAQSGLCTYEHITAPAINADRCPQALLNLLAEPFAASELVYSNIDEDQRIVQCCHPKRQRLYAVGVAHVSSNVGDIPSGSNRANSVGNTSTTLVLILHR
jgi:hypothetical protein